MRNIQNYLDAVAELDSRVYNMMGTLSQFTIDLVEKAHMKLSALAANSKDCADVESEIGSLVYDCTCALEVMDKMLPDYAAVEELKNILTATTD